MANIIFKNVVLGTIGVMLFLNLQGQGWVRFYGDEENQIADALVNTSDGGFLFVGNELPMTDSLFFYKTDSLGFQQWTTSFFEATDFSNVRMDTIGNDNFLISYNFLSNATSEVFTRILEIDLTGNVLFDEIAPHEYTDILKDANQGYLGISRVSLNDQFDVQVTKFSFPFEILWEQTHDLWVFDTANGIIATSDGSFFIYGETRDLDTESGFLLKINANGDEEWREIIYNYFIKEAIELSNEYFAFIGHNIFPYSKIYYGKASNAGEIIWEKVVDTANFDDVEIGKLISEGKNGTLNLVADIKPDDSGLYFPLVIKTDSLGNFLWSTEINLTDNNTIVDMVSTDDNGVVLLGNGYQSSEASFMMVKLEEFGNIFTNLLTGNAFQDFNLNCQIDTVEGGFPNQIIEANGIYNFYTFSDSLGNYSMLLDSGNYEIKLHSPNDYWQSCEDSYPVSFLSFSDTIALNLPMNPVIDCPLMQVQLSNNTLRPCPLPNKIIVQYCNEGTTTAEAALLEVTLHEDMAVDSISVNPVAVAGDLYTFALGDLAPFDCGQITFHFQLECDSVQLGQTLCAEAHIYPDTLCLDPVWTGPIISVDGQCHPDSITFIIENEGDDMPDPQQYIIIEDNIILLQEPYQLLNGETEEITIPKADNATYFMLAEQSPDLPPVLGNNYATFAIENCEVLPLMGIFNQFPLDDAELYFDELCRVVTGSYDPNDKQGFPTGFGDDHRIEQNVDLDYLIRFQNTGTDTAFTVVIRDNLSDFLDLTTLRPGASSHDYDLEIVNGRTLKFTFDNILLPDSTTNEPLSHGWVEFHIAQVADNPVGTQINNRADIFFDGNAPILTNTTEHLIGINFIDILDETTQIFQENVELKVYPNPAQEYAIFEIKNMDNAELTFKLFNSAGQLQRVDDFAENAYYFYRNGLMEGLYFYQIESEGALVVTGKLVLR